MVFPGGLGSASIHCADLVCSYQTPPCRRRSARVSTRARSDRCTSAAVRSRRARLAGTHLARRCLDDNPAPRPLDAHAGQPRARIVVTVDENGYRLPLSPFKCTIYDSARFEPRVSSYCVAGVRLKRSVLRFGGLVVFAASLWMAAG